MQISKIPWNMACLIAEWPIVLPQPARYPSTLTWFTPDSGQSRMVQVKHVFPLSKTHTRPCREHHILGFMEDSAFHSCLSMFVLRNISILCGKAELFLALSSSLGRYKRRVTLTYLRLFNIFNMSAQNVGDSLYLKQIIAHAKEEGEGLYCSYLGPGNPALIRTGYVFGKIKRQQRMLHWLENGRFYMLLVCQHIHENKQFNFAYFNEVTYQNEVTGMSLSYDAHSQMNFNLEKNINS